MEVVPLYIVDVKTAKVPAVIYDISTALIAILTSVPQPLRAQPSKDRFSLPVHSGGGNIVQVIKYLRVAVHAKVLVGALHRDSAPNPMTVA